MQTVIIHSTSVTSSFPAVLSTGPYSQKSRLLQTSCLHLWSIHPGGKVQLSCGTSLSPQAMPLEILIKEVIEERNSLCLGSHKRGFAVNLLFPFPLLRACAGGVPEQIPCPRLPAEPQVNLPALAWREFSPIMLPGESSTPCVSLGRGKKKKS